MSEPIPAPPAQPQVAAPQKKGFAVTALVLGIVAIVGSWIPFLSIGSIMIGLVGLVFGIIAVVKALKGTAAGKVMAFIGTGLSALAIILGFVSTSAGISAVDEAIDEFDEEITASTEPAASEPAAPAETEEAAAEEPEEEPAAAEQGTRDNPYPAGSTLGTDEVEVVLGDANWNADDVIAEENQFNEEPVDGATYVLLPVTITNVASAEPITPWLELEVFYVAPDGRSFDEASVVSPDDVTDIDDLYEGGTGNGNVVFEIPTDVQEGGVWGVELGWFSDTAFVAAQ